MIAILHLDTIRRQAEHAADNDLGPRSNPWPEDSPHFRAWLDFYYARINQLAVDCAA